MIVDNMKSTYQPRCYKSIFTNFEKLIGVTILSIFETAQGIIFISEKIFRLKAFKGTCSHFFHNS